MSRPTVKKATATVLAAAAIALSGSAVATAAPVTTPFQIQTFKLADLPTPQISATVGVESGAATFVAANPTNSNALANPISVRWFSLGTGASGFATFPAGGAPAPIDIKPGVGQVVALIEGGLHPGFGTFYVP